MSMLVVFAMAGCMSIGKRLSSEFEDHYTPFYSGVSMDCRIISETFHSYHTPNMGFSPIPDQVICCIAFIDAPFSFAADTLCLPYDIFADLRFRWQPNKMVNGRITSWHDGDGHTCRYAITGDEVLQSTKRVAKWSGGCNYTGLIIVPTWSITPVELNNHINNRITITGKLHPTKPFVRVDKIQEVGPKLRQAPAVTGSN